MTKFRAWPEVFVPSRSESKVPRLKLVDSKKGANKQTEIVTSEANGSFDLYVCGITPYDATHLGHAATYLSFDLINRYLSYSGLAVNYLQNITDVDDPLFVRASRDKVDWQELGKSQVQLFADDMTYLRVLPPKKFVSVSERIEKFALAVEKLLKSGAAYKLENDIYFDLNSYLKNNPLPVEDAEKIFEERGGDPNRSGKKTKFDPIMWCGPRENEPSWVTVLGKGRPGWHIECVVIATEDAGINRNCSLDMQGGGSDLIFPHHFMCDAINRALNGKPFAEYFIHSGMLGLDGEKMSKSKGNLVFVSTYRKQNLDPMVLRWAIIKDHYQSDRMWSEEKIATAKNELEIVRAALALQSCQPVESVIEKLLFDLSNNLDVNAALMKVIDWAKTSLNSANSQGFKNETGLMSRFLDSVLGIAL